MLDAWRSSCFMLQCMRGPARAGQPDTPLAREEPADDWKWKLRNATNSSRCPARARGLVARSESAPCSARRIVVLEVPRRSAGAAVHSERAAYHFICDRGGAKARHSQGRGQLLARTQHDRAVRAVLVVRRRLGARETRSSKDSGRVARLCAPGLTPAVHVSGSRRFALPSARAVQAERANQPRARLAPPYSLLEPHQQWAQGSKNTPTRFVASSALAGLGTRAMPAARSWS